LFDPDDLPFPRSLPEFQKLFPGDPACAAYLEAIRWRDGFRCVWCNEQGEPYRFNARPHVLRCRKCQRDNWLAAGTVMERSHTPLSIWFWGAYLVSTHTQGISAHQFQRQLGLKRYETAFQILHKLRAGMVRPERDRIGGDPENHVELDETLVGGATRGLGRGVHDLSLVVAAVEVRRRNPKANGQVLRRHGRYAGRVRLEVMPDRSAKSLVGFVEAAVEPGACASGDPWQSRDGRGLLAYRASGVCELEILVARNPPRSKPATFAGLPQRICIPLQQAVLSVQLVPLVVGDQRSLGCADL
jgi:Transposase zinc-ribbon domain/ISXO2-like transposase domain